MRNETVKLKYQAATEALWAIAEKDDTSMLESVLADGADVNAANQHGTTALMRAASFGRTGMVQALLRHGADPNASRNDEFTPLLLAVFFGHREVIRILVQHGAQVDAVSRFSTSAEMWATARLYYDVVDYLGTLDERVSTERSATDSNPNVGCEVQDAAVTSTVDPAGQIPPLENMKREVSLNGPQLEDVRPGTTVIPVEVGRVGWFNRRIAVYSVAAGIVLAALSAGIALRRQHQNSPPVPPDNAAVRTNAPAKPEIKVMAPPVAETESAPKRDRQQKSEDTKPETDRRTRTTALINTREKRMVRTKPTAVIEQPGPTPANSYVTKVDSLAATVTTTTPKPTGSRQNIPTGSRPAPLTNQLLSSPNESAPKGRVIRWP